MGGMRTIADWVHDARAASDPADAERCLDAATALAVSVFDWRVLLTALSEPPRPTRLAQCATRLLAAAHEEPEIWAFRDVAHARARHLGDAPGADEALLAAERALCTGGAPGYTWQLLAEGWVASRDAPDEARRVLRAGHRHQSGSVDGLCALAAAWSALGDDDAARALAVEAERLDCGHFEAWTLSNTWFALGDDARGLAVLERALEATADSAAALVLASAFGVRGLEDARQRAMARAEARAVSLEDWLSVAEAAGALGDADPGVGRALRRAEALAVAPAERQQVARAYHLWAGDTEAAERVGPRGLRPEALRRSARTLPGFVGEASALFDQARRRATPNQLGRIAASDYGTDAARHHAALADLCATGLLPAPLPWHPREVAQLYRWHTGAETDHAARLLCCVLLILADPDDASESTGALLLESALALGGETLDLTEGFLAWLATSSAGDEADDDGGDPLPLVLLALLTVHRDPADPRLAALAEALKQQRRQTAGALAERLAESLQAPLWAWLIDRIVSPVAQTPTVRPLLPWLMREPGQA